jgi:hypothetical protein
MLKWSPRSSFNRLSQALHTLAHSPENLRLLGETTSDCQAWADSEEAMATFYLTLLTMKKVAGDLHDPALSRCVAQLTNDYSAVLATFAVYLES